MSNKFGREGIQERLLSGYPEDFKKEFTGVESREEATLVVKKYLENLHPNFKRTLPIIIAGVDG